MTSSPTDFWMSYRMTRDANTISVEIARTAASKSNSVVNALPPAPVVGRNAITHTIVNALTIALSEVVPERITAAYYGMSNVYILSGEGGPDGRGWIFFDIEVGGGGGRPAKDGLDCYSQGIHNLANTPIEMVETTYPLRFMRYEFIPDSGGAGRSRGGLGVRRDIEFLDERGALDTQFDKFKVAPFGLFGGGDGTARAESGRPRAQGARVEDGRPRASPRRRGEHADPGGRWIRGAGRAGRGRYRAGPPRRQAHRGGGAGSLRLRRDEGVTGAATHPQSRFTPWIGLSFGVHHTWIPAPAFAKTSLRGSGGWRKASSFRQG